MKKSAQNKTKFLGVDYGTASNRLKKLLFFKMVQELGRDVCFKCSKPIETAKELSIDHKQPWLYASKDLFWDLDNIAFSHNKCNRPDRPSGPNKIESPKGKNWCGSCKQFLSVKLFGQKKSSRTKLQPYCNPCRKLKGWEK